MKENRMFKPYKNKTTISYGEFSDNENKVSILVNSDVNNKITAFYFNKKMIENIDNLKKSLKEKDK